MRLGDRDPTPPVEDYTETEREIPICDNPDNQYTRPHCKVWMKTTPIPLSTSVGEIVMKTTIRTIIEVIPILSQS